MAKNFQWLMKVKLLKTKYKHTNLKLARGKNEVLKIEGDFL